MVTCTSISLTVEDERYIEWGSSGSLPHGLTDGTSKARMDWLTDKQPKQVNDHVRFGAAESDTKA